MGFLSVYNNKLCSNKFFDNGFLREFLGIFFDKELILKCSHDELALHVFRDGYQLAQLQSRESAGFSGLVHTS